MVTSWNCWHSSQLSSPVGVNWRLVLTIACFLFSTCWAFPIFYPYAHQWLIPMFSFPALHNVEMLNTKSKREVCLGCVMLRLFPQTDINLYCISWNLFTCLLIMPSYLFKKGERQHFKFIISMCQEYNRGNNMLHWLEMSWWTGKTPRASPSLN